MTCQSALSYGDDESIGLKLKMCTTVSSLYPLEIMYMNRDYRCILFFHKDSTESAGYVHEPEGH
jgi:hypothetical protein